MKIKICLGEIRKMRLYNIYYLCKQYVEDVESLELVERGSPSARYYELSNWTEYKKVLFAVGQIECLKKYTDELYNTIPVFVRETQEPQIDSYIKNNILTCQNKILAKMQTIIELYESMQLKEAEKGIDVKIPLCNSLGDYISYMKELDFIFSQCPFLQHEDGRIEFNTVDVGSQWLSFVIVTTAGTAAAAYILNNLALLIDKAIQIKSHFISLRQQEEILRTQKMENDLLKSSLKTHEMLRKHYLSEATKEMKKQNEDHPLKDGEEEGKVEKSLEKLSGLLEKGVEIYASLNTEREIQALFPPLGDNVALPEDVLKYIEDKQENRN